MMRALAFRITAANHVVRTRSLLNKPQLRRFSEQKQDNKPNPKEEKIIYEKQETNEKPIMNQGIKYEQNNTSKSFYNKLERMEQSSKFQNRSISNLAFPIFLTLTSAFIYYLWNTCPYSLIYRHCTISEYISQKYFLHAIVFGSLSFQNSGHFLLYFPPMVYSFILLSKYFNQKHFIALFLTNCLLTCATTFFFDKYQKTLTKLLTPKSNGSVTTLCFLSAAAAINPTHMMFRSRMLPFFIIPFTLYLYEWSEWKSVYINEISRSANFMAIVYGLIFGLIFRFKVLKGRVQKTPKALKP